MLVKIKGHWMLIYEMFMMWVIGEGVGANVYCEEESLID